MDESSSADKSNILGDWHDIHGVGIFNAADGSSNGDNSIYLATHNGLYNKKQILLGLKLEMINLI